MHVKSNSSFHSEMINWAKVLQSIDCEVTMWDLENKPAYDVFDEIQPDIFIGNSNVFTDGRQSVVRCLAEYQDKVKIVMKEDYTGDPIEVEIPFNIDLQYVGCEDHYRADPTLEDIPLAANIFDYHEQPPNPTISSDLCYINMDHEAQQPHPYILPLCFPIGKYNIKIFDVIPWSNYCYMGGAQHHTACKAINSTKRLIVNSVTNNVSQIVWDARLCKVPMINLQDYEGNPDFFIKAIEENNFDVYDKGVENDYDLVLEYGTYFDRVAYMFGKLSLDNPKDEWAEKCCNVRNVYGVHVEKCFAKKREVLS